MFGGNRGGYGYDRYTHTPHTCMQHTTPCRGYGGGYNRGYGGGGYNRAYGGCVEYVVTVVVVTVVVVVNSIKRVAVLVSSSK